MIENLTSKLDLNLTEHTFKTARLQDCKTVCMNRTKNGNDNTFIHHIETSVLRSPRLRWSSQISVILLKAKRLAAASAKLQLIPSGVVGEIGFAHFMALPSTSTHFKKQSMHVSQVAFSSTSTLPAEPPTAGIENKASVIVFAS